MELTLPINHSEYPQHACVIKQLKDHCGFPIRTANNNPILDTIMYEIEFADGHKQALSINVIVESMFAYVDEEGHWHLLLDSIVGFRKKRCSKERRSFCCII